MVLQLLQKEKGALDMSFRKDGNNVIAQFYPRMAV
jgi:hypothetical protein